MTYKFIKDTLLQVKLHVDPHTVIWGEFPLITIKRKFRQKLNREMVELSNIIIQMDRYLQNAMVFFVDFFFLEGFAGKYLCLNRLLLIYYDF